MSWLNDLERDSFKKPSGYATRGSAPRSRGSFSRSRGSSSQKFTNRDNKENRISMDYNENVFIFTLINLILFYIY